MCHNIRTENKLFKAKYYNLTSHEMLLIITKEKKVSQHYIKLAYIMFLFETLACIL